MRRYVWRELTRNPRRAAASLAGIVLGVGLFAGVLFFVDGSRASMTQRAIAPLALDMQRVLDASLGGGLRFTERLAGPRALRPGRSARIELTIRNDGGVPANEVVVREIPPAPLRYVPGSARRDGARVRVAGAGNPFAQGAAGTGLNLGTIAAGATVTLTYGVRTRQRVADTTRLALRGRLSTRERVVPIAANEPPPLTAGQVRARLGRISGVASADTLSFVDLPAGALRAGGEQVRAPVRIFAFDERYRRHYPSIRLADGRFAASAALLSAEAARALAVRPGGRITVRLPAAAPSLSLPVSGVVDLSRAKPLFYSRKTSKLEDFLYVPDTVVVSPATFQRSVLPAFEAASARRGSAFKSLPVTEVDVLVRRSRLKTDPGRALAQTRAVARSVAAVGRGQGQLIDNVSNTLAVARDDAAAARRMFVFLGLPGVLLAAFLTAYAGAILAAAQRREQAILRIRGAHRRHLLAMLAQRTLVLAGAGGVLGVALGFVLDLVILGPSAILHAAAGDLVASALTAGAVGMLTTALALYIPGRRSLRTDISQERRELVQRPAPTWRRRLPSVVAFACAAVATLVALRGGSFDPPQASVAQGRSVELPSRLLLGPLLAWIAGTLLCVGVARTIIARLPLPRRQRFGRPVLGAMVRSLRRRSGAAAMGIAGVCLVVAFGAAIAGFAGTYDAAKRADAAFVVGSDIRVTPSALSIRAHPAGFARALRVPGVVDATPVVGKLENAVLVGPFDQNRQDLVAIDPAGFERVAALRDEFFAGATAARALGRLRARPRGLLVSTTTADDLSIETGDRVQVLLARGTKRQTLEPFEVSGLFHRLPGFPQGADLVANLSYYRAQTGLDRPDFFLARSDGDLAAAVARVRAGPARADALTVDSRAQALDKDQSSLTALNISGLVDLDLFSTLLMSAAAIAIFVFGLMLERRREYVTLRAQGMRDGELRALVLGELAVVAGAGVIAGLAVGTAMAALLVRALRGLFIVRPIFVLPAGDLALLTGLAVVAALVSTAIAVRMLRKMRPTELLRET
jgi:putative ABC transport system permease protein